MKKLIFTFALSIFLSAPAIADINVRCDGTTEDKNIINLHIVLDKVGSSVDLVVNGEPTQGTLTSVSTVGDEVYTIDFDSNRLAMTIVYNYSTGQATYIYQGSNDQMFCNRLDQI